MRGDVLDLILIVIVAAFAVSGYRQGFIVGVLSFVGFVGGALLGAEFGPAISRARSATPSASFALWETITIPIMLLVTHLTQQPLSPATVSSLCTTMSFLLPKSSP